MAKKNSIQKKTRIETRIKHPQEMINEIVAWYDFSIVQKTMEHLQMWGENDEVPNVEELKSKAYKLLRDAVDVVKSDFIGADPNISITLPIHDGGFQAIVEVDRGDITDLSLNFIVESWDAEGIESLQYTER
jgi:GTP cyclohydrolase III